MFWFSFFYQIFCNSLCGLAFFGANFWGLHVIVNDHGCQSTAPDVFNEQTAVASIATFVFGAAFFTVCIVFIVGCRDSMSSRLTVCTHLLSASRLWLFSASRNRGEEEGQTARPRGVCFLCLRFCFTFGQLQKDRTNQQAETLFIFSPFGTLCAFCVVYDLIVCSAIDQRHVFTHCMSNSWLFAFVHLRVAAAAFQGNFPLGYQPRLHSTTPSLDDVKIDVKSSPRSAGKQEQKSTAIQLSPLKPSSPSAASPFSKLGRDPLLYLFFVLGASQLRSLALVSKQFAQTARSSSPRCLACIDVCACAERRACGIVGGRITRERLQLRLACPMFLSNASFYSVLDFLVSFLTVLFVLFRLDHTLRQKGFMLFPMQRVEQGCTYNMDVVYGQVPFCFVCGCVRLRVFVRVCVFVFAMVCYRSLRDAVWRFC